MRAICNRIWMEGEGDGPVLRVSHTPGLECLIPIAGWVVSAVADGNTGGAGGQHALSLHWLR